MRSAHAAVAISAIAWTCAACTPAHSARDSGIAPGDDAARPTDAAAIGADAPAATIATCARGCATASDCTISAGAYDADNYRCDAGACVWLGCHDDAECAQSDAHPGDVCRDAGSGTPTCARGCTTPSDCTISAGAYDADNYACDAGACVWLGCHDDAECAQSDAHPGDVCR